jgi:hypothetical protein
MIVVIGLIEEKNIREGEKKNRNANSIENPQQNSECRRSHHDQMEQKPLLGPRPHKRKKLVSEMKGRFDEVIDIAMIQQKVEGLPNHEGPEKNPEHPERCGVDRGK